jgi:uncharacterized protein
MAGTSGVRRTSQHHLIEEDAMTNRWKLALAGAAGAAVAAVGVITFAGRAAEPAGAAPGPTGQTDPPASTAPPTSEPAGDASPSNRTITVSGHGTVSVTPDTADLMAGVQANAPTATEALAIVGTKSQALINTLKGSGVAEKDIQTAGLSLSPMFANDSQKITGYQASTNVTATIHDVNKVGDVVDALKNLVGDQLTLQGVSFSYADPEAVMADARTAAIANAKVRAEQYAKAAGASLGGVLKIVEGSVPTPVMYESMNAGSAPAAADTRVAVAPGSQELAADVSVVFEMT